MLYDGQKVGDIEFSLQSRVAESSKVAPSKILIHDGYFYMAGYEEKGRSILVKMNGKYPT